jgi:hypothetical protein
MEFEVKQALEQERRINADIEDDELPIRVFSPIMIDNSIIETEQTWAKKIREERHIGNFTEWQNKTSYRSALDRLLKDLKNASHHK